MHSLETMKRLNDEAHNREVQHNADIVARHERNGGENDHGHDADGSFGAIFAKAFSTKSAA